MKIAVHSFAGITATVFNGSGFIGRNVIARLAKAGAQVVIAYRGSGYTEEKLRVTGDLGQIYYSHFNLKDEDSLYRAMQYSNVVVNCIGKMNETRNFSFEEVHVEGPRRMARIARELGVKKFIHVSAMNASPDPPRVVLKKGSQFLRSKYYGELAVKEEFPNAIIFRPSDILGEQDSFMNHFTDLQRALYTRKLPIWDYYYEVEKQPVWISDVSEGIYRATTNDAADGRIFQAVGPYRYNFYDLIEYMRANSGQGQKYNSYDIINLRWSPVARLCITIGERINKYPPLTWERVEWDSLSDEVDPKLPTLKDLGVELTPLELKIATMGNYMNRFIKVEVPFESRDKIDVPARLSALA